MSHAAAMAVAMERTRVSLSGSKTRLEYTLKNSGAAMTAASQPASITLSHNRLSLLDNIVFPHSASSWPVQAAPSVLRVGRPHKSSTSADSVEFLIDEIVFADP